MIGLISYRISTVRSRKPIERGYSDEQNSVQRLGSGALFNSILWIFTVAREGFLEQASRGAWSQFGTIRVIRFATRDQVTRSGILYAPVIMPISLPCLQMQVTANRLGSVAPSGIVHGRFPSSRKTDYMALPAYLGHGVRKSKI